MGSATRISHVSVLLALLSALLAASACVRADASVKQFDVPAQAAGQGLNEFARQADITLIFSYDLVADERTRGLKGRFTVDHGLARLLEGTRLAYRQAADGTYLICERNACGQPPAAGAPASTGRRTNPGAGGGNGSAARLHDSPATRPGD